MALDGFVVANLVSEFQKELLDARISKIAQPEKEELIFTFKGREGVKRLFISANASLPFAYLSTENKTSPLTAPNFCMLLRKHISSGRITAIDQPHMERVIHFTIEHLDELGDVATKHLYVELMGKHSNIIFCDSENVILDSIKHISAQVSSVREVLPMRDYFIPAQENKYNPLELSQEVFIQDILNRPMSVFKAIMSGCIGFSPVMVSEYLFRCGVDQDMSCAALSEDDKLHLYHQFVYFMDIVRKDAFEPTIVYKKETQAPLEYAATRLSIYQDEILLPQDSISHLLETYYSQRNKYTVIHQKSTDLRKIVSNCLERNRKKFQLQSKQLEDTNKMEKYKLYGELLHTYGYSAADKAKSIQVNNYYTNEEITIPLDSDFTAMENAKRYFEKYNKLKRTRESLTTFIKETKESILHLESIEAALNIAENEADLTAIRQELEDYGYIKKHKYNKKQGKTGKSKPLHFISSDGYDIYVGKNNYQNDELTFKLATGNDWWFHAKQMPGSHVIVKTNGQELPDKTFEEAAALAGYYSSGRDSDKVEIDYLQKKNVKKPNGSAAGFVIYHTNYSMTVHPQKLDLQEV